MLRFVSRLWICLLTAIVVRAASSLEHARTAAEMLGAGNWSHVLKIENPTKHGGYPATVYALVFEFGGMLWFYTDTNGTQSLSRRIDDLAAEKAELAQLVRDVDPGFDACAVVPGETGAVRRRRGAPPFACFIASVAALRERVARGEAVGRARLLSFYGSTSRGKFGHTILTYETPAGAFALDPEDSRRPRRMDRALLNDPRRIAEKMRPDAIVTQARWVPTTLPPGPTLMAAAGAATPGTPRRANLMK